MSERDDGSWSGSGVNESYTRLGLDEQVCETLASHPQVDASQVGVAVDSATGDLVLFGTVPTEEQRQLAEDCAVSVRGVSVIYNRLVVGRCAATQGMDESAGPKDGGAADSTDSAPPAE